MANECLAARLLSGKDNTGSGGGGGGGSGGGGGGGTGTAVSTIYDPRAYGTTTAAVMTPTPVTFQPTRQQQPGKRCTCWIPPSDIPHLHKCNSPPRTMCHTNMFVLYTFLFFTAIICLTTSILLFITRIQGSHNNTMITRVYIGFNGIDQWRKTRFSQRVHKFFFSKPLSPSHIYCNT